tara:strand:+ start:40 stop:531 length:492 start_codon:yes stop_codon:yes gene_type:complete
MAIPGSGALNLKNMAQECAYGTWGSGTITNPISVRDLVAGGNSYGSGQSYPSINTNSASYPPSTTPVTFQSFYSYDKDATASLTSYTSSTVQSKSPCSLGSAFVNQTYYHDGSSTLPGVNDSVYSDSAGTTPLSDGNYKIGPHFGYYYHIEVEDEQVSSSTQC